MGMHSFLKEFGEYEAAGSYDHALSVLAVAMRNDQYRPLRSVLSSNLDRIARRAQGIAKARDLQIEPVHVHEANPNTYKDSSAEKDDRPLVALTAISSRLDRLNETISTILNQTLEPHSVNLYLSKEPYLIDEGVQEQDPRLRELHELGANIYFVKNIGPYRKQYPILKQLHDSNSSPNTCFVTIDDDVIYPENVLESLMRAASTNDAVVSHRGRKITFSKNWFAPYKSFVKPSQTAEILHIGTGRNGIAYRLKHFPRFYDDYIGPCIAPTADDLWCKYVTAAYCVPTVILEPTAMFDTDVDFKETLPEDKHGLFHNFNAKGRNDVALNALELYFGRKKAGLLDIAGVVHA